MIEIKNVWTGGFEGALRGMRNPYESHAKSDSGICMVVDCNNCSLSLGCWDKGIDENGFVIGKEDMKLCKKLIKGGSEHRKFLRMIHVQADVKAPRYWWAEMDKYKYVEANSSSTMHLITKRELTQDDFSMTMKTYERMGSLNSCLNELIEEYQETKDEEVFLTIKQLLPESYNQLRTIDADYECLLNIYHQRKNHRLPEWREFCNWIEGLLYMQEFLEVLK